MDNSKTTNNNNVDCNPGFWPYINKLFWFSYYYWYYCSYYFITTS